MGLLLALSVVPVTGQPAAAVASFVNGCRELLAQCLIVLRAAGAPLHWIPIVVLGGGLVYATVDRAHLTAKVSRLLRWHIVREPGHNEPVGRVAAELGCLGIVHLLVGPAPNPAFTAGILRPRIYIAEYLQDDLTPGELAAVCRHELYHARHHDPLRFALLRFAAKTLFWLPLVGVLGEDLMEGTEITADDFAAEGSDPLDVASALVKIGRANARSNAEVVAGIAALGGFRSLDRRVRRLADECPILWWSFEWRPMLLAMAALFMLWGSAAFAPQPLDAAMTMHFGEQCPHAMPTGRGRCPECDHKPAEMMSGCEH